MLHASGDHSPASSRAQLGGSQATRVQTRQSSTPTSSYRRPVSNLSGQPHRVDHLHTKSACRHRLRAQTSAAQGRSVLLLEAGKRRTGLDSLRDRPVARPNDRSRLQVRPAFSCGEVAEIRGPGQSCRKRKHHAAIVSWAPLPWTVKELTATGVARALAMWPPLSLTQPLIARFKNTWKV
jgi:hypothetical protein